MSAGVKAGLSPGKFDMRGTLLLRFNCDFHHPKIALTGLYQTELFPLAAANGTVKASNNREWNRNAAEWSESC
jgi:hypothetical protein